MRTTTRITLRAHKVVEAYVTGTAEVRDRAAEINGGKPRATILDHGSAQSIGTLARRVTQDARFHTLPPDLQADVRDIAKWCENRHSEPPSID